jgi:hypothetical protein
MTARLLCWKLNTLPCIVLLTGWSVASQALPEQASPDVCAKLSPALVSTTLGDEFAAPVETSAPGGEFKGDYVSCLYTAKALTFEFRRWAYPNPALRERSLQAAKARYAASARAKPLSDLGDSAWAINEYVDIIQGPYEYYFAAYPTESPNYHVDQTDKLTTIAKAFLSP